MRHRLYDDLELSPNVNPMCGYDWIREHLHDLDNFKPSIELISEHSHYRLSGNQKQVNEAIRVYTNKK